MTRDLATSTAEQLARRVRDRGVSIAVAESLTCGTIASTLGATENSSSWFRGGIVAYSAEVKFDVLGVARGPVVSRNTAVTMAEQVARLCDADLGIAATGVGGPTHEEDLPPGTVFIASTYDGRTLSEQHHFPGGPDSVLAATIHSALALAIRNLDP